MKNITWLFGLLLAGLLASTGCKKSDQSQQAAQPMEIQGVKVDLPKLRETFANAPQETQTKVSQAVMSIRYGQYTETMMALDKLANDPNATEPQKKVVNDVIEQMKQVIAKAPAK